MERYKSKEANFLNQCLDVFMKSSANKDNSLINTILAPMGTLFKTVDVDPGLRVQVKKLFNYIKANWDED